MTKQDAIRRARFELIDAIIAADTEWVVMTKAHKAYAMKAEAVGVARAKWDALRQAGKRARRKRKT